MTARRTSPRRADRRRARLPVTEQVRILADAVDRLGAADVVRVLRENLGTPPLRASKGGAR